MLDTATVLTQGTYTHHFKTYFGFISPCACMASNTTIHTHHFKTSLHLEFSPRPLTGGTALPPFCKSHHVINLSVCPSHTIWQMHFGLLPWKANIIPKQLNSMQFCAELIADSLENAMISQSGNYNPFSALPLLHSHFTCSTLLCHSRGITPLTGTPVLWALC